MNWVEIDFDRVAGVLATFAIHSTLFLGGVGIWFRVAPPRRASARQAAWKIAILGAFLTTPLQCGLHLAPWSVALGPQGSRDNGDIAIDVSNGGSDFVDTAIGEANVKTSETVFDETGASLENRDSASERRSLANLSEKTTAPLMHSERASGEDRLAAWTSLLPTIVALLWTIGATFGLARIALARIQLARRADFRELRHGRERRLLDGLLRRAGVRRSARLVAASRLASPMAWGLFRWRIAIPEELLATLGPKEMKALLAHELGHLIRRDTVWNYLLGTLGALGWFQPLHRLARRMIRRESEYLCDSLAVQLAGDRLSLAKSLTTVAERLSTARKSRENVAMVTSAAADAATLVDRLGRLLDQAPLEPSSSNWRRRLMRAIAGLIAVASIVAGAPAADWASARSKTPTQVETPQRAKDALTRADTPLEWAELKSEMARIEKLLSQTPADTQMADAISRARDRWRELNRRWETLSRSPAFPDLNESRLSSIESRSSGPSLSLP